MQNQQRSVNPPVPLGRQQHASLASSIVSIVSSNPTIVNLTDAGATMRHWCRNNVVRNFESIQIAQWAVCQKVDLLAYGLKLPIGSHPQQFVVLARWLQPTDECNDI
jgi:hypothetical protein